MFDLLFPREVRNPRTIIVNSKKEYIDFINANINSTSLFTTVYSHSQFNGIRAMYESLICDRLYFDCDYKIQLSDGSILETDGHANMLKLHEWCVKNGNIKHMCLMTGTSYAVYIAVEKLDFIDKKCAIYNAQRYLCDTLDIKVDEQGFGDAARISRIPNTFNFKKTANRFCIPLKSEQLYLHHDEICKIAEKQQFNVGTIGEGMWDIRKFDTGRREKVNHSFTNYSIPMMTDLNIEAPNCVKRMLSTKTLSWKHRGYLICFLRDNGYTFEEVIEVLRKTLTPEKFVHCVKEEVQPQYIFNRRSLNLYFPNCSTIQSEGFCRNDDESSCEYKK
jgi:hypothetical protein